MSTESEARRGFREAFGSDPTIVVRAPGRVNLIGEHTDYSDLPVLPIAIEQSIYVAAGALQGSEIKAESREFAGTAWHRYADGVVDHLRQAGFERGACLFVASDLPSTGGLSSSSALTCGALAALSAAWDRPLGREEILRLAVAAEHNVGVESGAMDQTVILFAQPGSALRIDFRPPGRRPVPILDGLRFVVASSGQAAPKADAAKDPYNERVAATRTAAALLAGELGIEIDSPPTLAQVASAPGVEELVDRLPEAIAPFARHVLTEAARVDAAERALLASDFHGLGRLLDESQRSLALDFRCGTSALDRLCAAMRQAGAFGARLTGAGFGGFALAACPPAKVERVIDAALAATGGPAFEVTASAGLEWL